MDRKAYLDLCRRFSLVLKGVHGQPETEHPDLLVRYGGREYWPLDYTLSYQRGEIRHTAGLREKHANAYLGAPLDKVEAPAP